VAGAFDRLEIWSPERYTQVTAEGTASMGGDPGSGRTIERE
jgi:DNA-binding transcriptional regulator/RsmH inhibitor MraZ